MVGQLMHQLWITVMMIGPRHHQHYLNRKFDSQFKFLQNLTQKNIHSLSPNNDNSSESGSESTSPESSSEESNNGSAKVENNQEKNKWCLSSFVQAKSTQPSQDSQPAVTNIKHEPNVIDDDNDSMYVGQMQNSMNPIKDLYQQQTTTTNSKSQHSQNNCDLIADTIKQEPPGKWLVCFSTRLYIDFCFVCFRFFFGVIERKILFRL